MLGRPAAPVLAALALRLACLPFAADLPTIGDAHGYVFLARELREGRLADLREGVRPPLPRLLAAPVLDDRGSPYPGVYLVQIAADVLACAALVRLTRRRFGPAPGVAAGWCYALFPPTILVGATVVMTESLLALAAALALLALDALDRALARGPAPGRAALLGLALGLGMLTKELMTLMTAVVLATLVLRHGAPLRRRLAAAAVTAAVAGACVTPWALHNQQRHGLPVVSGTYGQFNLLVENAPPGRDGLAMWREAQTMRAKAALALATFRRALLEYPRLTFERAVARLRIAAGPEIALPAWFGLTYDGLAFPDTSNVALFREGWRMPEGTWARRLQRLCGVAAVFLFALGAAGLAAAPPCALRTAGRLLALAWLATLALTVADARYRIALVPFLCPFAGLGAAALSVEPVRARLGAVPALRGALVGLLVAALLVTTIFRLPAP